MRPHALVIDDNGRNAEVLETLLVSQGVDVSLGYPLNKLPPLIEHSERFDVVFLDLEFPDTTGFDLIGRLREYKQMENVPIIAYTVHTSEVSETREKGFQGFLGKPIRAQEFPDHLKKILNGIPVWEY